MTRITPDNLDDPIIRGIIEPFLENLKNPEWRLSMDGDSMVEFVSTYNYPYLNSLNYYVYELYYIRVWIKSSYLIISYRKNGNDRDGMVNFNLADPSSISAIRDEISDFMGDPDVRSRQNP